MSSNVTQSSKSIPESPYALPKDATEMYMYFILPIHAGDKMRVLVNGPTGSLTVDEILETESKEKHGELRDFVKDQFTSMKKVQVNFLVVKDADEEEVELNFQQIFVQLMRLSVDCVFAISANTVEYPTSPSDALVCLLFDRLKLEAQSAQSHDTTELEKVEKDERDLTNAIIEDLKKEAAHWGHTNIVAEFDWESRLKH